jgi:transcription elongation factor Elf1
MAVRCIRCGKPADEANIRVEAETGNIHCGDCDEEYTAEDVAEQIREWTTLLNWILKHPAREPAGANAG